MDEHTSDDDDSFHDAIDDDDNGDDDEHDNEFHDAIDNGDFVFVPFQSKMETSLNQTSGHHENVHHPSGGISCFGSTALQQTCESIDHNGESETAQNIQNSQLLSELFVDELPHESGSPGEELPGCALQNKNQITANPEMPIPWSGTVRKRTSNSIVHPGVQSSFLQSSEESSRNSRGPTFNMMGNKDVHITNVSESFDPLKSIHGQTKLRLKRDLNPQVFVKTEKIKECEKTLKTWGVLLLTGGPGEGKTTAGLHLLKMMSDSDSRCPLILTDPNQWDHVSTQKNIRYAILVDDAFGRTNLVEDLKTRWEQKFPMMLPLIEAGSVCIIFAFRKNIYLQYGEQIKAFELLRKCKPVNLSSDDLSEKEKLQMFDLHLKLYCRKANITDNEKLNIIKCTDLVSFPICCYMFTSNINKYDRNFFYSYLKCLGEVVSSIRQNDPEGFLVLLLVMFYDNLLPERVFDVFEQRSEDKETLAKLSQVCRIEHHVGSLLTSARNLRQTFLFFDSDTRCFSFKHNSIQDAVFMEFCKDHLSKGLEMCSTRTLLEYVTTDQGSCHDIVVVVSKDDFAKLAKRLIKELFLPNNSAIFTHQAFKESSFRSYFLNTEKRKEIEEYSEEIQCFGMHHYLTDTAVTFFMKRCLNQPTMQHTFDPKYVNVLSVDSIPACFVLNGADRIAIRLLKLMKQDEQSFSRHADKTLACSFYMNNQELADELIELGATITFDCFKAVCIAPRIDENLVELAAGIISEEHADALWNLLTLSLENGHFECIKQMVLYMARSSRFLQLEEFCRRLLILGHTTIPSWIPFSLKQTRMVEIFELLHSQGVNCFTDCCVLLAAGCHDSQVLNYFVRCGGNVHCKSATGQTPLHLAALYGPKDTVMYLLQQKVEKHARDKDGYTPLHRASQSCTDSYHKTVLLADENAQLKLDSGESVLNTAIKKGDIETVEYICSQFANITDQLNESFYVAVAELARTLFFSDRHPEKWIQNRCHIVLCLIKAGFSLSDLDDRMIAAISLFAERGKEDILQAIVGSCNMHAMFKQLQDSLNYPDSTYIVKFDRCDLSRLNFTDTKGKTLLHFACEDGDTVAMEYLVRRGAKLNTIDMQGKTPLHYAFKHDHTAMAKFLVESGADVNASDRYGKTPLQYASCHGETKKAM